MEKILISGYLTYGNQIQFFLLASIKDRYWFFPITSKLHFTCHLLEIQEVMDFLILLIKNNIQLLQSNPLRPIQQNSWPANLPNISTLGSSKIDWEFLLGFDTPSSSSYDAFKEKEIDDDIYNFFWRFPLRFDRILYSNVLAIGFCK